jgi:hypothetical protein
MMRMPYRSKYDMTKTPSTGIPGRPPGMKKRGRPKSSRLYPNVDNVRIAAQAYTDLALTTLANICKGTNDSARVRAAEALLDRGYGKTPLQTPELKQDATQIKIVFAEHQPTTIDAKAEPSKMIEHEETDFDETEYDHAAD